MPPKRGSKKRSAQEAAVKEDEDVSPSKRQVLDEDDEEVVSDPKEEEDVDLEENNTPPDAIEDDEGGDKENINGDDEIMEDAEEVIAEESKSPVIGNHDNDGEVEEANAPGSARKRVNAAGRPAEAGVIKTIYVENFMCHPKLKVELCRNVNFIHGQNGSGKSAILAAIQICLGSNARRTHRASNVKDLVRKEAAGNNPNTSAKVRVTLLNGGDDGYKQDVYGERINVERCISLRNGYNGYKLYDENMKEVSRNKKDLEEMLDHLNIQVDNPVAILGQEDAKMFLKGKASDKYSFFLKATELSRLSNTFCQIKERTSELALKKDKLHDDLEHKHENVLTLKKKLAEYTFLENLQKKRLAHEVDYGWALYSERDEEYQNDFQKMNSFKQKAADKQLELSQAEEELSGANDANEERRINEKMEELKNEAESQTTLKRNLEAELKLAQNPVKLAERKIKNAVNNEKKSAARQLNQAQKRLKDARAEFMAKAESANTEAARREKLLNDTEEALAQAKSETDETRQAQSIAYQKYEELEPAVQQAQALASQKKKECDAVSRKLQSLRASSNDDSFAIFGQRCSALHQLVEECKRKRKFRGEVVGPVGAYIKITPGKEKYAELAENAVGNNTLDRWIVTCDQDRKLMDSLRQKAKCNRKECGLFQVSVSPRYNITQLHAEDIETVATVLSISNDIVFNCLVDNGRIDQRALAPSKEVSEERLLKTDANGRYSIKGIIREVFFLPRGDKWEVRDGTISMQSNDRRTRQGKIGIDKSKAIEDTQDELRQLQSEHQELETKHKEMAHRHKDLQRDWNVQKKKERANQDAIAKLTRKKEEIEMERETTANDTLDTSELEEDVQKYEEELEQAKQKETELKKELSELQPAVEQAKARLAEVVARNEKVLSDMRQTEENLERCLSRMSQQSEKLQKKRDKVKQYQEVIDKHKAKVASSEEERSRALLLAKELTLRQQRMEQATEKEEEDMGSQLSQEQLTQEDFTEEELAGVEIQTTSKDSKYYEAKINRAKAKIEEERKKKKVSTEERSSVTEQYLRAKQALVESQDAVEHTDQIIKALEKDIRNRQRRHNQLHEHLGKMIDSKFDEMLDFNGASGSVEFDDEKKQLHLVVQKDKHNEGSQTRDVNALSGGERSFTTISLLLALGECLETPFRVLDEFDVFLDTQVRKMTIKILINIAEERLMHRQFIFITPQDLSSVTPKPTLKIFKLKPPERNQVAGGATQQTLDFSQT